MTPESQAPVARSAAGSSDCSAAASPLPGSRPPRARAPAPRRRCRHPRPAPGWLPPGLPAASPRAVHLRRIVGADAIDDRLVRLPLGNLLLLFLRQPGHRFGAEFGIHVDAPGRHGKRLRSAPCLRLPLQLPGHAARAGGRLVAVHARHLPGLPTDLCQRDWAYRDNRPIPAPLPPAGWKRDRPAGSLPCMLTRGGDSAGRRDRADLRAAVHVAGRNERVRRTRRQRCR
jgi:hypothetical protein